MLIDCNLHNDESLINKSVQFKTIKFFIVCAHTAYLSTASSVVSVNYINNILLILLDYCSN